MHRFSPPVGQFAARHPLLIRPGKADLPASTLGGECGAGQQERDLHMAGFSDID